MEVVTNTSHVGTASFELFVKVASEPVKTSFLHDGFVLVDPFLSESDPVSVEVGP